jgi:hypothetical protein
MSIHKVSPPRTDEPLIKDIIASPKMAIETNVERPDDLKPECTVAYAEQAPVLLEDPEEEYQAQNIDVRTVLGLLVNTRYPPANHVVNQVAGSGHHLRIMPLLIRTSCLGPPEH